MVDAKAKAAGYDVGPVYHATDKDFEHKSLIQAGGRFLTTRQKLKSSKIKGC